MTRDEWMRTHAAIAAAGGMLSGALARNANSPRLTQDILSLLRPVMRALEIEELNNAAKVKREEERPKLQERRKPERQKRKE